MPSEVNTLVLNSPKSSLNLYFYLLRYIFLGNTIAYFIILFLNQKTNFKVSHFELLPILACVNLSIVTIFAWTVFRITVDEKNIVIERWFWIFLKRNTKVVIPNNSVTDIRLLQTILDRKNMRIPWFKGTVFFPLVLESNYPTKRAFQFYVEIQGGTLQIIHAFLKRIFNERYSSITNAPVR